MAEEIAQAAWARGWERRDQLRSASALQVWIASIAKNMARLAYRRQSRTEELFDTPLSPSPTPFALQVDELLERCRVTDRSLLIQHYVLGYSSSELASQLGVHPVSIRVRLLRIKEALRDAVEHPRAASQLAPPQVIDGDARDGTRGGVPHQQGSPASAGGLDTARQK